RLRGERTYKVQPLGVPDARVTELQSLRSSAAVELFVSRAQDARDDFELTPANAPTVANICRKLDGLPLALELAATWVRSLPLSQLLENLADRLNRPDKAPRDLPVRHQKLQTAIEGSHALLTAQQRQLFRCLGVFAGGCSLQAIE